MRQHGRGPETPRHHASPPKKRRGQHHRRLSASSRPTVRARQEVPQEPTTPCAEAVSTTTWHREDHMTTGGDTPHALSPTARLLPHGLFAPRRALPFGFHIDGAVETTDETQDAVTGGRAPATREDPRTPGNDGQVDPPPQEDRAAQIAQL